MSQPAVAPLVFKSIPERIAEQAAARPDRLALIGGDRTATFLELDTAMDRVAATLQAQGAGPQDVIAICASSSIEYAEVFCGSLRGGLAVAPLAPSATPDSLVRMVTDCGAKFLFIDATTSHQFASLPTDFAAQLVTLDDSEDGTPLSRWLTDAKVKPSPVTIEPSWPFNIIYSSGTTGVPKGIVQPHQMRTPLEPPNVGFGYGEDAVALISTGLYSNTTLCSFFPALAGGGTVVLMAKFDAREFLELAQRWRVTHAMLVPVQYQRLMAHPDFAAFDLSAFRMKFSTSAPLSAALKADILTRWPGGLTEYYGMTEGGGGTVLFAHEHPDKLHTVGRPWPHTDIRLIGDDGREVAPGEVGEIVGASGLMMTGYHNQPEKTSEATWYDAQGQRFIRHGDIGCFDADGFLILMDRKKDMIISGGFNVYPSDLEAVLREHPAVSEAAVVGVPSEAWGETPVGFVACTPGAQATADEIRTWANARLGKVQRLFAVRIVDALPRSHIGKVLKRELRDGFKAGS